jgi:hypothetical protein
MADAKITALTENTAPALTDITVMVDDPAGTPATQKVTMQKLLDLFSASSPNNSSNLFHQGLINGNFDIWQRGTSIANTTANSYSADQWYVDTATAGDDKTVSQQTAGVDGSRYSCRVQRVSGETGHTVLRLTNAIESHDSIKFRGQKVTLSFYLKVGANFSAASSILTAKIVTGKGADQRVPAFTTSADAVSSDITATTSWVKHTITTSAVIASDITQIGVSFSFDPVGTASTNDWFEIAQVQLCAGEVVLPFQAKSYESELAACQRFYQLVGAGAIGKYVASSAVEFSLNLPVTMRSTPALALTTSAPVIRRLGIGNNTCSGSSMPDNFIVKPSGLGFQINGAGGSTGDWGILVDDYIITTAEF